LLALTPESGGEPAVSPALGSLRHPLARALLLLTFSTGLVDAASYLGLGHVFAANMTGNVACRAAAPAGPAAGATATSSR
jgi:hypothetical protein